jgi:uncharacterized delta-60 repeat protein
LTFVLIRPTSLTVRATGVDPRQRNGKIIVAGQSDVNGTVDFVLIRYKKDGREDRTFGHDGRVLTDIAGSFDFLNAVTLQPNGRIVVAGGSGLGFGNNSLILARYTSNGKIDRRFGQGGFVSISDTGAAEALTVDGLGRILVAGAADPNGFGDFLVARVDRHGRLDPTFGSDNTGLVTIGFGVPGDPHLDRATAIALQSDGNIVVSGTSFVAASFQSDFAVARLSGTIGPVHCRDLAHRRKCRGVFD